MLQNKEIKSESKKYLKGNRGLLCWSYILIMALIFYTSMIAFHKNPFLIFIYVIVIQSVLSFGYKKIVLKIVKNDKYNFEMLFSGFKIWVKLIFAYFIIYLAGKWIILINSFFKNETPANIHVLLFLISIIGIIYAIYIGIIFSQTFFIIVSNEKINFFEAIKESVKMMKGYKWKYFCLIFSFFWWFVLGAVTLGIMFIWIMPHVELARAKFYTELLKERVN